ncbi:MAG: hypothetical protein NZM04_10965 [Methylacidiphilales bacterium]|nr:hypothetical protein [Candidatus Methylacidiphilales bacterium]MDW8349945.1 hypothetical protein [Verrucomicrobiae bacterium]
MILQPAQIHESPIKLEATLPPSALDLNDALARATHPLEVYLIAQRVTPDQIIVRGTLKTTLTLICGRCGLPMPWPVNVSRFTYTIYAPFPQAVDLTPQLREDILIEIPHIAQCKLGPDYVCPYMGERYPPRPENNEPIGGQDNWKALDQLINLKDKE